MIAQVERIRRAIPSARAYHDANQAITSATFTPLAFNQERWDNDGIHDTVTDNSRLTCRTPGLYIISGTIQFDGTAVGIRQIAVYLNGATNLAVDQLTSSTGLAITITTQYRLVAGDYVQLRVYQDAGTDRNVITGGNYSPEFMMSWIAL